MPDLNGRRVRLCQGHGAAGRLRVCRAAGSALPAAAQSITCPSVIAVPTDWGLKPSRLGAGDTFRLMFVTERSLVAASADIADYNRFVQNDAAGGHSEIEGLSRHFRALGST